MQYNDEESEKFVREHILFVRPMTDEEKAEQRKKETERHGQN